MALSPPNQSKKRAAPGEDDAEQPRKKEKLEPQSTEEASQSTEAKPARAPFNALPVPPPHPRPAKQLFIFGNGDNNQFGLGPDTFGDIVRPRPHNWVQEAVQEDKLGGQAAGIECVSAGGMHTLMIDEGGKIWTWGNNDNGSLGRITDDVPDPEKEGETLDSETLQCEPMLVQSLVDEGFRAVQIVAGDSVSVALSAAGQLKVWGSFRASDGILGFDGKPNSPKIQFTPMILPILEKQKFVQVACGVDHVLALTAQGHVWVWGNGQQGQLGRKIIERRKVNGLSPERLALRKIKVIGTGLSHSFAVDHKGVVYAWGLNLDRQTGITPEEEDDHQDIVWEPTEVKSLNPKVLGMNRRVVEICGGEFHTLFRISDGSVYACGRCDDHQLGFGSEHPAMKEKKAKEDELTQAKIEQVTEERRKQEKKRRKSDLANGHTTEELSAETNGITTPTVPSVKITHINKPALIDFPCGDTICSVSANGRHNLALSTTGEVFSWGLGLCSQLGLGKDPDTGEAVEIADTPKKVESAKMKGWKVEGISAGGQHCVLLARQESQES